VSKSFDVPQAVSDAAARGLRLRKEHGRGGLTNQEAGKIGIGSGVQRASDLVSGSVSYETVKRMLAFFNRHKVYKEYHDDNPPSNALISWLLWGGDPGYEWAKRIVAKEEKVEKGTFLAMVLFPDGLPDEEEEEEEEDEDEGEDESESEDEPFQTLLKKVPKKYLEGAPHGTKQDREEAIKDRKDDTKTDYSPLPGDEAKPKKKSKYTRTKFADKVRAEMQGNDTDEFLRAAAKVSGVSISILREVHKRGSEAWATSGHRVGASQVAWARARVYSFVTGGTTQKTADKDLWTKHKNKS
jgi:hypothetical protein